MWVHARRQIPCGHQETQVGHGFCLGGPGCREPPSPPEVVKPTEVTVDFTQEEGALRSLPRGLTEPHRRLVSGSRECSAFQRGSPSCEGGEGAARWGEGNSRASGQLWELQKLLQKQDALIQPVPRGENRPALPGDRAGRQRSPRRTGRKRPAALFHTPAVGFSAGARANHRGEDSEKTPPSRLSGCQDGGGPEGQAQAARLETSPTTLPHRGVFSQVPPLCVWGGGRVWGTRVRGLHPSYPRGRGSRVLVSAASGGSPAPAAGD